MFHRRATGTSLQKNEAVMFQKLKEKRQKAVRFLFGSFTATALMFTFQACYGMPGETRDFDAAICGRVTSAQTGEPIQGISVCGSNYVSAKTAADGSFTLPVYSGYSTYSLSFVDEDGEQNGLFADLDTIVPSSALSKTIEVQLHERAK